LPAYSSFPLYLYYAGPKGDYTNTKQGFFGFDLGMKQEIMEVLNDLVEKNYGSYLRCISKEEIRFFAKQLKKEIVLGSEGFMETVKLKMEVYCQE
ncbi:MAG: hypothetical protein PHI59_09835, partial [Candidatus Omnitrophica bacterium]|nr:hypothetical protein [Candidatus Omnitrophota bacterium]